jgi:cytochrome d ubiquinol oxidase subunit I
MDPLTLARWQFGITTVYHFLFVPLTIGLSGLVAGMQTLWLWRGRPDDLRLTRFFGELFLINFALGVVTGIVQEFQFGMNWSAYSRFVGDIFGAPLAIEGLLAFFLESTFLGLWIFGWERLPRPVHLASIWLVALGTLLSAYFILVANAWMQHPVGFRLNPVSQRAELTDFLAVLTNPVATVSFLHTVVAAYLTAGAFVAGVAAYRLLRHPDEDAAAFRRAARLGAATVLVTGLLVLITGDQQARVMTDVQPMKMAAAEALYQTSQPASFSLFTIGTLDGSRELFSIRIPNLLSLLATGSLDGRVEGINDLQQAYAALYGPGDYRPIIPVTYWTFRLMIGAGALAAAMAAWILWQLRRAAWRPTRWQTAAVVLLPLLPLAANTLGWIFTEMGRQPWIVFGLMSTAAGVSPGTSGWEVLVTLLGFTLVYGVLAAIEVGLLARRVRGGLPSIESAEEAPERPPSFAY